MKSVDGWMTSMVLPICATHKQDQWQQVRPAHLRQQVRPAHLYNSATSVLKVVNGLLFGP